ncbi:PilC/PilY family type IV pilus protein [Chondromyces crocatus]|uniref:Uncharacterized protein n=1 Tax=Chondromyces crocatus TaxID=52 RepID=A0A0K1EET1_CHOCO|nr:PilC/PilY family type IV pilus protein [Chondromyces crocatus]AKT39381.1 uncharacterized protein CMC5_035280 [Chondromyces crocatus]
MRSISKLLLIASTSAALSLHATSALAQLDLNPLLPNVLLLLDTSGSMERTVAGNDPTCSPGGAPPPEAERSRWTNIVEALTGPIQNFSCYAQPRSDSAFLTQYAINGAMPYDRGYYINYHRPLSNGCTKGPHNGALVEHPYNNASGTCGTPWNQLETGFLDNAKDLVRFSMMTFDTLTNAGTGVSNSADGVQGMWSYYLGFQSGGSHAAGQPPGCLTPQDFEVGARNPAAPDWEGPLVPFPAHDASLNDVRATNERIQQALLTLRPYGATPLAGMLADARVYLTEDGSDWNGRPLGPKDDPCIAGRDKFIVLLSDGEPNMDLRDPNPAKDCSSSPGPGPDGDGCPYRRPWNIAEDLYDNHQIRTFTIGYSLSAAAGMNCNDLNASSFNPGGVCEDPQTSGLRACCTLTRIAIEGGSPRGYFPNSIAELNAALSSIFIDIARVTSRTVPVSAAGGATNAGSAGAAGYEVSASFQPQPPAGFSPLWGGLLERKRYKCESQNGQTVAVLQTPDQDEGDFFAENMRQASPAPRRFFTVFGEPEGMTSTVHSTRSIRPIAGGTDGLGTYTGAMSGGGQLIEKDAFTSEAANDPRAFGLDPSGAVPSQCTSINTATAAECARGVMNWQLGDNVADTQRASLLGAVYHSTPTLIGPPRDLVTDDTYEAFANQFIGRPLTLYTATTDGQLHAFNMEVNSEQQNELWSFFPPHVLPRAVSTFNQQAPLLDGAPVVKNVIFERSLTQAIDGTATWRTVLVASGGAGGSFYYALDVTDPTKPSFLWQLSTDDLGAPLFGESPPTPAIATIEVSENGDPGQTREVAVAILAGGGAPLGTGTCDRQGGGTSLIPPISPYQQRTQVRCWGNSPTDVGPGRSLTIVRLDNGRVIRTFRGNALEGPQGLNSAGRVTVAAFDSPLTGIPVIFPSQAGQIADRVYIGDADGTLWRINLASADPDQWTVQLAWDAYSATQANVAGAAGQPIATTPIVSLDEIGNTIIMFSTGDQERLDPGEDENWIWSLKEGLEFQSGTPTLTMSRNWHERLENGRRVTGPISLFDSVAYFSTYSPPDPSAGALLCDVGASHVWGLHYTLEDTPQLSNGRLPKENDPLNFDRNQEQEGIVFGVAVMQTPSCTDTVNVNDPYFGAFIGPAAFSGMNYELRFHTGNRGISNVTGGVTPTRTINLPRPATGSRIDSWASVVE